MKSFFYSIFKITFFCFCFFIGLGFLIDKSGCARAFDISSEESEMTPVINQKSILVMELEGVILDGEKFLKDLRSYSEDPQIVAVLVRINSPGGVVGPSQEIYSELKRIRETLKKPVVVSCNSMAASGAYYAAMGSSTIFTNPGTLMGSIGVIMEFADMQELYQWAKVKPFALTSGKLKNAGAAYKPMSTEDQTYFQSLIDETYKQFTDTVQAERKLSDDVIRENTDGRVFNGATAVKLGFADKIGGFSEALQYTQELVQIKGKPNLIYPSHRRKRIYELLSEARSTVTSLFGSQFLDQKTKLLGKPLMIVPGVFSF